MKKIIYLCLGIITAFTLNACSGYLDINESPDDVSNTVPEPSLRLRSIQTQFVDCYESSGTRGSWITQNVVKTAGTASNDYLVKWDPQIGSMTWPYQAWFIYTANNIPDLLTKAEGEQAWHYMGAAKLIYAWGFMTMLDLYGEMPFTEALGTDITPAYDDGETIYKGCMAALEEAITYFDMVQPSTAPALSDGDIWNGGDVAKWKKLAYGLKARWLLNCSKKSSFDPDKVLEALNNAAQSNTDNTIMNYSNSVETQESGLRALQNQNIGTTSTRTPKFYMDLLTNTFDGGSAVEDPRTDLLVPSAQFHNAMGQLEYRRTAAVDLQSDIRKNSGPVSFDIWDSSKKSNKNMAGVTLLTPTNIWYSSTKLDSRKGDSIYVSYYSECLSWVVDNEYNNSKDDRYLAVRYNGVKSESEKANSQVTSTGTFYTRGDAPGHLLCYPEICFMKAECYFRKGEKAQALTEYKKGIRAHMELMNEKLAKYDQSIFGKQVISEEKIAAFLTSAAVAQSATELTMAKIMQQKFIACSYSLQNWNDMRRFNYSAGNIKDFGVVYPGYARPAEFDATSAAHFTSTDPNNERYWMRRFQQCSIEVNYNSEEFQKSNEEALKKTINSLPVWWDTTE
ncbi:MAG: hypothetical protein H6Q13_2080 [Bacteroidetes bacterium]|nr:hypothetical protein [Bacteroidota bacterium]